MNDMTIDKFNKVKNFLKHRFPKGIQMFDVRNWVGDPMKTIYYEDGITVDYCEYYDYIEVFGLTTDEFSLLKRKVGY